MEQNFCYDKTWTQATIEELDRELSIVCELLLLICDSSFISLENYEVLRNVQRLESSIQTTKKVLQNYMESMDNQLSQMETKYKVVLENNAESFSDEQP